MACPTGWNCHKLGSLPEFDVYDLEFYRSDNPGWLATAPGRMWDQGTPAGACNW